MHFADKIEVYIFGILAYFQNFLPSRRYDNMHRIIIHDKIKHCSLEQTTNILDLALIRRREDDRVPGAGPVPIHPIVDSRF